MANLIRRNDDDAHGAERQVGNGKGMKPRWYHHLLRDLVCVLLLRNTKKNDARGHQTDWLTQVAAWERQLLAMAERFAAEWHACSKQPCISEKSIHLSTVPIP
ncbi:MAG TPA: hypothetical protein VHO91_00845 [Rhodopila sp.]|nr:hypothetical protein [Rhodopila sp.]